MHDRYFYHCFPRRSGTDDLTRVMSVLSSILERGLLLTPERISLRESLADGNTGPESFILQKRLCFTELTPSELVSHCKVFGPVAIEWKIPTLIEIGAVPVFYVPLRETPLSNDGIASSMLLRLGEIQELLSRLESLQQVAARSTNSAEVLNVTRNGVVANTSCTVSAARDLLQHLGTDIQPIGSLTAAVRFLFGYYYPTENLKYTGPLGYYRQREWRLLANGVNRGTPITEEVSPRDIEALIGMDQQFFGRELDFPTGRQTIAQQCHLMRSFRGVPILMSASRIIVPGAMLDSVSALVSDSKLLIELVSLEQYGGA